MGPYRNRSLQLRGRDLECEWYLSDWSSSHQILELLKRTGTWNSDTKYRCAWPTEQPLARVVRSRANASKSYLAAKIASGVNCRLEDTMVSSELVISFKLKYLYRILTSLESDSQNGKWMIVSHKVSFLRKVCTSTWSLSYMAAQWALYNIIRFSPEIRPVQLNCIIL